MPAGKAALSTEGQRGDNVRVFTVTLKSTGRRFDVAADETVLEAAPLALKPGALQDSVAENKRRLILAAWQQSGGDHNLTAERLKRRREGKLCGRRHLGFVLVEEEAGGVPALAWPGFFVQ